VARQGQTTFGPVWLAEQLKRLIPNYPDVSFCVALSGGADSTALLAALAKLDQTSLRAIHVNHGLHENAPRWAEHCRRLAEKLRVPLKVFKVKVDRSPGTSLEAEAREVRYAALAEALAVNEYLLTGHHEDDQLETVMLQLMRGAGLAGLSAMPSISRFASGWHARPLLQTSRAEVESWLREQSLTWIEDDTNADERLDRNYLRRKVLPAIRERWPSAARTVSRSARHIAEGQALLDALARMDVERASFGAALSAKTLRTLALERRRNALRYWIAKSNHPLPDTTRLEETVTAMLAARPDANPQVAWQRTILQREADLLTLRFAPIGGATTQGRDAGEQSMTSHSVAVESPPPIMWRVRTQSIIELPGDRGKLELRPAPRGPIDLDALPRELAIRWRKGGERLRPRRGGPSKSLKSLLQSSRVPLAERARAPLLFDGDRLLVVGDFWSDAAIQAGAHAKHRVRIVWHRYPSAD
jgi:tRNA(Ile)-lysidine synthase